MNDDNNNDDILKDLYPTTQEGWIKLLKAMSTQHRLLIEEYKQELANVQWFLLESRARKKYVESGEFKDLNKPSQSENNKD